MNKLTPNEPAITLAVCVSGSCPATPLDVAYCPVIERLKPTNRNGESSFTTVNVQVWD